MPIKRLPVDVGPKHIRRVGGDGVNRQVSLQEMFTDISERSAIRFENAPDCLYINSWCLSVESMAMWEIYGDQARGVAVKSSLGRFQRSLRFGLPEDHVTFGAVDYHDERFPDSQTLDLRSGPIPVEGPGLREKMLPLALHKRRCYAHEREWRAVIYQDPRPDVRGIDIAFDPQELIAGVYVGPRAEKFVSSATEAIPSVPT